MATVLDSRLKESFALQRDPALVDPVQVPWNWLGLAVVLLLAGLLLFLRLRRAKPVPVVAAPSVPLEDILAALEAIWRQSNPDNIAPSITALAAVVRRYLSRLLAVDCTTATTFELTTHFSRPTEKELQQDLLALRAAFFESADQIRFAGVPATLMTVRGLYEIARDFVKKQESAKFPFPDNRDESASSPTTPSQAKRTVTFHPPHAEFTSTEPVAPRPLSETHAR